MAFVGLGIAKKEVDDLYEELEDNNAIIAVLEGRASEENVTFPLKEQVEAVQHELNSAAQAYTDWEPSKVHMQYSLRSVLGKR